VVDVEEEAEDGQAAVEVLADLAVGVLVVAALVENGKKFDECVKNSLL
jgi:hypothetical protein